MADASKLVSYAVLDATGPQLSKHIAFAVLNDIGQDTAKLIGYAVLQPSARTSKLVAYAALRAVPGLSKLVSYSVIVQLDREQTSKLNAYAVLGLGPLTSSKLIGYTILKPLIVSVRKQTAVTIIQH
jgi:hypothetical protein